MRTDARWLLLGLLLIFPARALLAQEEPEKETPPPPPAERPAAQVEAEKPSKFAGKIFVQADFWYVQPAGLDYLAASVVDTSAIPVVPGVTTSLQTSVLDVGYSAAWRPRYQLGYNLDNGAGTFSGSYWSESQEFGLLRSDPGNFKYGEILAFPLFAGLFEDGLADAFEAHTRTDNREWRLDFSRRAFDSPRIKGRWLVGWREVNHKGVLEVEYKALNPSPDLFPPVIFPPGVPGQSRPGLLPNTDSAVTSSGYSGRGPEAGMEFQFPFGKAERFSVDTGLTFALLRGDLTSSYSSFTSFYGVVVDGQLIHLAPPYTVSFFADDPSHPGQPLFNSVVQYQVPLGFTERTVATNGTAVDAHLGFRVRTWKGLEVTGGFRSSYYAHVGTYILPGSVVQNPSGVFNIQNISHKDSNLVYEGLYMGIAYTY